AGEVAARPVTTPRSSRPGEPGVGEAPAQDRLRAERLRRDAPRGRAVRRVVAVDACQGVDCLLHGGEGEESLAGRDELVERGVLRDHRATGGQVADAAVAEPADSRPDVDV